MSSAEDGELTRQYSSLLTVYEILRSVRKPSVEEENERQLWLERERLTEGASSFWIKSIHSSSVDPEKPRREAPSWIQLPARAILRPCPSNGFRAP